MYALVSLFFFLVYRIELISIVFLTKQIKLVVLNPATGDVIGSVPDMGPEDAELAIESAAEAFKTWKTTSPKVRNSHCHQNKYTACKHLKFK